MAQLKKVQNKHFYSKEELDFLAKNVKGISLVELTRRFNQKFKTSVSKESICRLKSRHGIKGGIRAKPDRSHFRYPVGHERVNKYGFIEVKVAQPDVWKLKHHVIYEKHFGKIPPGNRVVFSDKNKRNFDINNLALFTRSQQLTFAKLGIKSFDISMKNSVVLMTKINSKIRQISYKKTDKKRRKNGGK